MRSCVSNIRSRSSNRNIIFEGTTDIAPDTFERMFVWRALTEYTFERTTDIGGPHPQEEAAWATSPSSTATDVAGPR